MSHRAWFWPVVAWVLAAIEIRYALLVTDPLIDTANYWRAWHGPLYGTGFAYPPAGALLFLPAAVLPFGSFAVLMLTSSIFVGVWLLWPLPLAIRLPAVAALTASLVPGNAAVLLALPLALAPRWPLAWPVLAWTKVTPAIGMISLVRQRRWRALLIALNACALVGLATLILAPVALHTWLDQAMSAPTLWWLGDDLILTPPLWLRLPIAAALAVLAASRPWLLAVAAIIATPDLNLATIGLLAAAPRLGLRSGPDLHDGGRELRDR